MIDYFLSKISKLATSVAGFFSAYVIGWFKGKSHAERKAEDAHRENLENIVGFDDGALADRLRNRARKKDRNKRSG